MAYSNQYRAQQLRRTINERLQRMDQITGGSAVSACQHRRASEMQQELRRDMAELDKLEGNKREPFKEPSSVMTDAQVARIEALVARLPASDKNAILAREVLDRPDRRVTGREAFLLGIGR